MKRYTQTLLNDCFATSIACILERPPDTLPNFCFLDDNWPEATNEWLARLGLFYMDVKVGDDIRDNLMKFWGWHVISGDGPRGHRHSVVGRQGQIVYDPHFEHSGLLGEPDDWEYGFLISLKPQAKGGK